MKTHFNPEMLHLHGCVELPIEDMTAAAGGFEADANVTYLPPQDCMGFTEVGVDCWRECLPYYLPT